MEGPLIPPVWMISDRSQTLQSKRWPTRPYAVLNGETLEKRKERI